jgi:hypothetical protein
VLIGVPVRAAIERVKSQLDGVGSEETVSDHGPVLEEFMPLKPSLSLSSSDEHDSARDASAGVGEKVEAAEAKKATPDWLQSVQLWSQEPQQQRASTHKVQTCSCRVPGSFFFPSAAYRK